MTSAVRPDGGSCRLPQRSPGGAGSKVGEGSSTFHEICNGLYAEVVWLGQEEGVFNETDPREAATVVRALVDGLFTQWIQEKDWQGTHAEYREICKRSVLAYLTANA